MIVLQELLDLSHFVTRLKLAPEAGSGDPIAEGDRARARPLAEKLTVPVLARAWQMLLKGLEEVQVAPSPIQAAEMVLVRLAYVADLPVPAELVRSVMATPGPAVSRAGSRGNGAPMASNASAALPAVAVAQPSETASSRPTAGNALRALAELPAELPVLGIQPAHDPMPQSFAEVIALFDKRREALLRSHLWSDVHLVHFEPGRIEVRPAAGAPRDLTNRLGQLLSEWTGSRWLIAVSEAEGEPTLREQEEGRQRDLRNEVTSHPLVQAVLETFPGATIAAVRERFAAAESDGDETSPEDPGGEAGTGEDGA
jgi:DNA polymerase-3 subunit gamma/tau